MSLNETISKLGISCTDEADGITEYLLAKNGLKILLREDRSTPVVNLMIVYNCGSRHEGAGTTGSAHFFEHLAFKGTRMFDPMEGNGPFDLLGRMGAYTNANTSYDRTRYFECVPPKYLELCIKLEANRMRGLKNRSSDRDSEMTVVRNEFERNENSPGSALFKEVMAAAYKEHPYHNPVIGSLSDVEGVPMPKMVEFYDQYYWPNNATVIVSGNFDSEQVLTWVHKYFGRISRSPRPIPTVYTREPAQEGQRRVELRRNSQGLPQMLIAYHIPEAAHEDSYALAVLSDILGNSSNPVSRFYKALVESKKVSQCSASTMMLKDPGVFFLSAQPTAATTLETVEALLYEEIERLVKEPPMEEELALVKEAYRNSVDMTNDDPLAFVNHISNGVGVDSWRWAVEFPQKVQAVTATDVQRVAAKYFSAMNRTVGYFIPSADVPPKEKPAPAAPKPRKPGKYKQRRTVLPVGASSNFHFADRTLRTVLPNGLTVCVLKRGKGCVAVNGAIMAGDYFTPKGKSLVATLTGGLLTSGTLNFSKQQIAAKLQSMRARLGFEVHVGGSRFGSLVPSTKFSDYITLLADVLQRPLFAEPELERMKLQYNAWLRNQLEDTGDQAHIAFLRRVYPEGHPLHAPTTLQMQEELEDTHSLDLTEFHSARYNPASTVLTVVGDIDPAEAVMAIENAFGHWNGLRRPAIIVPPVSPLKFASDGDRVIKIPIPDKANVDIHLGHATDISRFSPDYYAAQIAAKALGGDTIKARLGKSVRVTNGLTYGINCDFGGEMGIHGAAPFSIQLSVNPGNVNRALALIKEVCDRYAQEGISAEELEDNVGDVAEGFAVSLRSSASISSTLCRFEFLGLGAEGVDHNADAYRSVTKEQVDAVIRKWMTIDNSLLALAGTF